MLVIDDLKKLAKMQELLLERTINGREENLEKYKRIVMQIDDSCFSSFLDELNQINKHNQTLEEELEFLEQVRSSYQQLLEQQLGFKRVCELYGDTELQLSDLSQVDIEYIDSRISAINGYLINQKNIETNKIRLQQLNEDLIKEEKNKEYLSKKMKELEKSLRNNFINAEGRCIVDSELQYVSVISEYDKLGINFREMLGDTDNSIDVLLSKINEEVSAAGEKLKVAELCFEAIPSIENKQILDDITRENLKVKYKESMIKILKLLIEDYDNLELFREKREKLLDLIKYRANSLKKLGINVSIDPFVRTRISEQLEMVVSLEDSSKNIDIIMKEMAGLSRRVEHMISQNRDYMIQLNDTKDLLISRTSIGDIDISNVKLDEEEHFEERTILDNQVVNLRVLPKQFNSAIVKQKTSRVLRRVNEMVNNSSLARKADEDKREISTPELVIVPSPISIVNGEARSEVVAETQEDLNDEVKSVLDEKLFNDWSNSFALQGSESNKDDNETPELEVDVVVDEEKQFASEDKILSISNSDMFMTVNPFLEAPLFPDRVDEDVTGVSVENTGNFEEIEEKTVANNSTIDDRFSFFELEKDNNDASFVLGEEEMDDLEDKMLDDFWPVQEVNDIHEKREIVDNYDDVPLTFEQQVKELMADESDVKTRKLVA